MPKSLFDKKNSNGFKISRTKIDDFIRCPRCFYLDRKLGIAKPSGPPFTLNVAVDGLLKKEFDFHRKEKSAHPLMKEYGVDAVPFQHEKITDWRNNFTGIWYDDPVTGFHVFGALDDVWVDKKGDLIVVDYKATSTSVEITLDGGGYKDGYKREVEVYQWLLRKNGFKVSNTAYFVYVNARKDLEAFHGKLEFRIKLLPYVGNDSWIDKTLPKIKECLDNSALPPLTPDCEFCTYRKNAAQKEL